MFGDGRPGLNDSQLTFLIVFRLILTGIFIPLYVGLITILLTQKKFYSVVAYNVMVQIGIVDIMCLLSIALAGIMNIYHQNFPIIAKVATYYRCLYFVALLSFSFLLALNRFFVYNQLKCVKPNHYKYISAFNWIFNFVILPLCIYLHPETEGEYDYLFAIYFTDGLVAQKIVRGFEIAFYVCTIVTYLAIVIFIIVKRLKFNLRVKLSSPETRILLQAFLLFFPPVVVFAILMVMFSFSIQGLALLTNKSVLLTINIIHDLLPAINLVVQVAFNRAIKEFLWERLLRRPAGTQLIVKVRSTKISTT